MPLQFPSEPLPPHDPEDDRDDDEFYCDRCGEHENECLCCGSCGATLEEAHDWDCDEQEL